MASRSDSDSADNSSGHLVRAAQYVRMSTELQQYSTQNQREAINEYAKKHGMKVARTYADEGKSGLAFKGRPGLRSLISDVTQGRADYTVILVYDVRRCNPDTSASERYPESEASTQSRSP